MRDNYANLAVLDERDYPPTVKDIPDPREQKFALYDKMREQKETLKEESLKIKKGLHIKEKEGEGVSKKQFIHALKDIDGQNENKNLWGINEKQLLVKNNTEDWIKKRQNAGMQMLKHMKDQEFAK